ncbi:phosphoribosylformimino-5-aminoimidazole carboxamide ribotide isomerase [Lachnospiraceae bacterium LCP25S3_G4]
MKFRPCIDIHNGTVKQIIGGTLADQGNQALTNFTSKHEADYYARLYKKDGLKGGHIIMLNATDSEYYEITKEQAVKALHAYRGGLQVGGGITAVNAKRFIEYGASHVIVTSYLFEDGRIKYEHLENLKKEVGKAHIVIDLSCRRRQEVYYVVTNRWQTFTKVIVTPALLEMLSEYCDEFLIHGVDVEGKSSGIEQELVTLLSQSKCCPITYAGGIGSMKDIEKFYEYSNGKLDFTIGSALDLFGGNISYETIKCL